MRRRAGDLGLRPETERPVHGGDTALLVRMDSAHGPVAVKRLTTAMPGMLPAEAAGLEWLGQAGMRVPAVLAVSEEALVLRWIETTAPSERTAEAFGAALARLHDVPAAAFGAAPEAADGWRPVRGWVGAVPVRFGSWPDWGTFYADARLVPVADLARARGRLSGPDRGTVAGLCDLLRSGSIATGADAVPRVVHGDLWSGNVLWNADAATLIDPSAHGETDLAMLSLFATPHLPAILAGYLRVRTPAPGWRDRLALHQVFPLLVHAAMFGGDYGRRAAMAAQSAASGEISRR